MLKLGISTCPNDTFMFYGWTNTKLSGNYPRVRVFFEDIATLNEMALAGKLDIIKVSFFAYAMAKKGYALLNCGGAVGRGCGPVIVAKPGTCPASVFSDPETVFALPGKWTTAALLLECFHPASPKRIFLRFDQLMDTVLSGRADAAVVIHEGRFTYRNYGLEMIGDLGAWWENKTGLPVPLGGIIARKTLSAALIQTAEQSIRRSLHYARNHPEKALAFAGLYAEEMSPDVMQQHINLFVNNVSLRYDKESLEAIDLLVSKAEKRLLRKEKL